jgi:diaminohydroxyphosphoribosylaminopyrimidine deaminase / 5-amino-6-(5-phosphoribosylamino)uracil reductase
VLCTFFDKNLVNEVWAFVAPVIIGGNDALSPIGGVGAATLAQAFCLKDKQIEQLEEDLLIRGKVVAKES